MTHYTIQTTVTPAGTLKIYMNSDLAGLTVPSSQTIMVNNDLTEKIDVVGGTMDVEQIDLDFVEDYTNYAEGFWHKLLQRTTTQIQLTLDEGSGETHLFFGIVQQGATPLTEISLTAGAIQRQGTMHVLSFLAQLKLVTLQSVIDACFASGLIYFIPSHIDGTVNTLLRYVRLQSFIDEAIVLATGQSYTPTDVTILSSDIKLESNSDSSYVDLQHIAIYQADLYPLTSRYTYAWDFILAMCLDLGLVPRWKYDVGRAHHRIDLLTRGTSYAGNVTLSMPKESTLIEGTPQLINYIELDYGGDTEKYYYDVSNAIGYDTEPNGWQADMIIPIEVGNYRVSAPYACITLWAMIGGDVWSTIGIEYWNYFTGAWVNTDGGDSLIRQDHALAWYYAARLGAIKRVYERTYTDLKANDGSTNSHVNISLLRNTQIDDGTGALTFYATEVHKNLPKNELFVRWQQV